MEEKERWQKYKFYKFKGKKVVEKLQPLILTKCRPIYSDMPLECVNKYASWDWILRTSFLKIISWLQNCPLLLTWFNFLEMTSSFLHSWTIKMSFFFTPDLATMIILSTHMLKHAYTCKGDSLGPHFSHLLLLHYNM